MLYNLYNSWLNIPILQCFPKNVKKNMDNFYKILHEFKYQVATDVTSANFINDLYFFNLVAC